jgi:hypothetical protein
LNCHAFAFTVFKIFKTFKEHFGLLNFGNFRLLLQKWWQCIKSQYCSYLIQGTLEGELLTSCLTGFDQPDLQIKTKNVSCHTADSKPVKQEQEVHIQWYFPLQYSMLNSLCVCSVFVGEKRFYFIFTWVAFIWVNIVWTSKLSCQGLGLIRNYKLRERKIK